MSQLDLADGGVLGCRSSAALFLGDGSHATSFHTVAGVFFFVRRRVIVFRPSRMERAMGPLSRIGRSRGVLLFSGIADPFAVVALWHGVG